MTDREKQQVEEIEDLEARCEKYMDICEELSRQNEDLRGQVRELETKAFGVEEAWKEIDHFKRILSFGSNGLAALDGMIEEIKSLQAEIQRLKKPRVVMGVDWSGEEKTIYAVIEDGQISSFQKTLEEAQESLASLQRLEDGE